MLSLESKKILLGVTGGIAAYKIPALVRLLKKSGAAVRVILTNSAKDFVSPLTLQVLSQNPVLSSFTSEEHDNPQWNNHVELGNWADVFLIAPATSIPYLPWLMQSVITYSLLLIYLQLALF